MSLRGEFWAQKTSINRSIVIEVSVLRQESERSCMLGVSISSLSTILIFYFGILRQCGILIRFVFH